MWKFRINKKSGAGADGENGGAGNKEKKPVKRRKGRKGVKRLIVPALLIAAAGGIGLWQYRSGKAAKPNASVSQQRTARVTRGTLTSELSSSGTISPKDTYSITSLVEGEVISADFEEGDIVEKDQVLYQIDASSMESELKSANNSLERAVNNYNQALEDYEEAVQDYSGNTYKATRTGFIKTLNVEAGDTVGSNTELAAIYNDQTMKLKVPFLTGEAAAIAAGSQATVILTDTEEELAGVVTAVSNMDEVLDGGRLVRYVTLEVANPGGLSTSHQASVIIGDYVCSKEGTFEPVTNTTMQSELPSSVEIEAMLVNEGDFVTIGTPLFRINSSDVEDILQSYKDSVDSAEERVESAQSSLDSTQDNYENYTITAPISGQVITKSVKAGDNISRTSGSSATTMAVIYDLSEMTFEMSVDELDVGNVQVGQKVEIEADALEGVTFSGTVTNISLEYSQSNGVTNYPVTVTIDDVGDLLPGMNVDGRIILDEAQDVLMIPVDSLMRGNCVYVKDDTVTEQQGTVPAGFRAVEVETGLTSDEYVEIVSGLSEGDEVYVDESTSTAAMMMPMGGGMNGGDRGGGGNRDGGGRGGNGGNGGGGGGGPMR